MQKPSRTALGVSRSLLLLDGGFWLAVHGSGMFGSIAIDSQKHDQNNQRRARSARRRGRTLAIHSALFAVVNGFMVATWMMTKVSPVERGRPRPPAGFWPGWLLITWGSILALHAIYVRARRGSQTTAGPWAYEGRPRRIVTTVLFTDIVESTRLAAELGDRRWGDLIERHDRQAKMRVEQFGGWMVKTLGDGLLAIFEAPRDAILCANALRDDLKADGIDIRVGLHSGEVDLRQGDIGGIGVHIASRIMSAAGTSEILASRTVRDLVAGSDIAFAGRGSHKLKGVEGEWQLFSVARVR